MKTLEIRNIERVEDKNLTLVSYFVAEDGVDKTNGTYELEGLLEAEEVLAKVKEMDTEVEVSLNLTGQKSDAGDSNSEETPEQAEARAVKEAEEKAAADKAAADAEAAAKAGEAAEKENSNASSGTVVAPRAINVLGADGKVKEKFTAEKNGPDFVTLAKKFANDNGWTIELE